nr:glycosyltransferase family 4 protein [Kerstersia gyiorum]
MAGGTRSYEMARRMVAAGHDVHIVTSRTEASPHRNWLVENIDGINVHYYPVPYSNKMGFYRRMFSFIKFSFFSTKKTISLKGDVVFATSTPLTIAIPGVLASKFNKIPFVFEVRDLWPEIPVAMGVIKNSILKKMAFWLARWAYENSKKIVALSDGMKDGIVAHGVPDEKVSVISNGSDLELFDPKVKHDSYLLKKIPAVRGRKIVVYTGTFGAVNGVDYMVSLAAESKKAGYSHCFVAIGAGAFFSKARDLAESEGVLNSNFWIFPEISKMDIVRVLSECDVSMSLVVNNPVLFANSANKIFDALAAGKPIIINYGGWQADLIDKYDVGLVLDCFKYDVAARELHNFLTSASRLRQSSINARLLAERDYSRDCLANKLISLLEGVVAS